MYNAICRRIVDVERELEDVKQLLSSNPRTRNETEPGWENEWMNIVQDVLEKDAGWNWTTFWQMVLHGLDASIQTQESAQSFTTTLFPPASRHLQPPLAVVKQNVKSCFNKFCRRQQEELKGEFDMKLNHKEDSDVRTLKDIVAKVGERLGVDFDQIYPSANLTQRTS